MSLSKDDTKRQNRKNYIDKGFKTHNVHSKNEIVKTIESNAINDSAFEHHNNGYNKQESK